MSFADVLALGLVLIAAFLLSGALAPFEALGWWAGWYGRNAEDRERSFAELPDTQAKHFIIFLSGIHSVAEETYAKRERGLLERLRARLPDAVIAEAFPYSVTNRALTAQRTFAAFWRLALRLKLNRVRLAGLLINMRNIWQVAVSADRRYGPIYNQGSAEVLYETLLEHAYRPGSGLAITLIGYSGGGQIALGAARYLKEIVKAPVSVISIGGVLSADPGVEALEHLYHLYGDKDRIQRLGFLLFPGRWPLLPYSAWNRAKARGFISFIPMGPVDHTGRAGYLDRSFMLPDGRSALDQTTDIIVDLIETEPVHQRKGRALRPVL